MNLGIEIGGTKLQFVLGEHAGAIQERRTLPVDAAAGANGIREQIRRILADWPKRERLGAVGVGFGGPVNWRTGKICRSHQVAGWSEFDLAGWLRDLTGAAVRVDNDANTAALGEARAGAGTGFNPVFYVTLGSGVGGGLVVDGRVYHGATPGEAEIGHLRLDRQGTIVESHCSGWAVDARIRKTAKMSPTSLLSRRALAEPGAEARHLSAALEARDAEATRLLEETAADLAFALSHVVHLFHPEVIIIGGGLSRVGEPLRAGVDHALKPLIMEAFAPGPEVRLAGLGDDAVPAGALELAREASGL